MLLHLYTRESPEWNDPGTSRIGHGLGGLFGRLFSKTMAKTVAKTVGTTLKSVAKKGFQVGQRALKTAVKKAAPLAKEALKEGISAAADFGSEKAVEGIQKLAEKSIKHGAPESLAHSLARAAEQGTKAIAQQSVRSLNTSLDRIAPTHQTSVVAPTAAPTVAPAPQSLPPRTGGPNRKRRLPMLKSHRPTKRRRRRKATISNLLDEI